MAKHPCTATAGGGGRAHAVTAFPFLHTGKQTAHPPEFAWDDKRTDRQTSETAGLQSQPKTLPQQRTGQYNAKGPSSPFCVFARMTVDSGNPWAFPYNPIERGLS